MMRGVVSFHPVDPEFFDDVIAPLLTGGKINPESYLERARRVRLAQWYAERFKAALAELLRRLEPPPSPEGGSVWQKVRARLERFDYSPDPTAAMIAGKLDPDLHLDGRPFLVTEGSADRVAVRIDDYRDAASLEDVEPLIVEQLLRLDRRLPSALQPADLPEPAPDARYRSELLADLKALYDLSEAARRGTRPTADGGDGNARDVLKHELAWRATYLHSRAYPFWIGRDVDGLEAVCRAAEVPPPEFLGSAGRLFLKALDAHPGLIEGWSPELKGERDVGAFVPADEVSLLLSFLGAEGSRIIRAASKHGEGPACATLLRKIRECADYAERHGTGYLEATGILPPGREEGTNGAQDAPL